MKSQNNNTTVSKGIVILVFSLVGLVIVGMGIFFFWIFSGSGAIAQVNAPTATVLNTTPTVEAVTEIPADNFDTYLETIRHYSDMYEAIAPELVAITHYVTTRIQEIDIDTLDDSDGVLLSVLMASHLAILAHMESFISLMERMDVESINWRNNLNSHINATRVVLPAWEDNMIPFSETEAFGNASTYVRDIFHDMDTMVRLYSRAVGYIEAMLKLAESVLTTPEPQGRENNISATAEFTEAERIAVETVTRFIQETELPVKLDRVAMIETLQTSTRNSAWTEYYLDVVRLTAVAREHHSFALLGEWIDDLMISPSADFLSWFNSYYEYFNMSVAWESQFASALTDVSANRHVNINRLSREVTSLIVWVEQNLT